MFYYELLENEKNWKPKTVKISRLRAVIKIRDSTTKHRRGLQCKIHTEWMNKQSNFFFLNGRKKKVKKQTKNTKTNHTIKPKSMQTHAGTMHQTIHAECSNTTMPVMARGPIKSNNWQQGCWSIIFIKVSLVVMDSTVIATERWPHTITMKVWAEWNVKMHTK